MNKIEISAEIERVCGLLEETVPEMESLTKADLEAKLTELENLAGEREVDLTPEPEPEPEPVAEPEPQPDTYIVAKAALRSIRGIIVPGGDIEVKDISGGQENFNRLMGLGYIVKK